MKTHCLKYMKYMNVVPRTETVQTIALYSHVVLDHISHGVDADDARVL